MTWAAGNGLISLVLLLVWHLAMNRKTGATVENYGVTWSNRLSWRKIGKSLLLAVCIVVPAYLLLLISDAQFKTDFRLWVLAVKPMSSLQFQMVLAYLIPFAFYFLVIGVVLNGQLRLVKPDGSPVSWRRALLVNVALMIGGIVLLLLLQYIPLMAGNPLPIDESLLAIVAFQFVPLLTVVALVSTYFFRKTGHIYVGAFLNAMLITWIIVAAQATHFAF
jgi:hypothetical protein